MIDVAVIDNAAAAEAALEPARARLLAQLTEPRSAAMLAAVVGLPRQKVNYHLRTLEQHGLVELVEERRKGNVTERLLQAVAASYVISPSALAAVAPDPARAKYSASPPVRTVDMRSSGKSRCTIEGTVAGESLEDTMVFAGKVKMAGRLFCTFKTA